MIMPNKQINISKLHYVTIGLVLFLRLTIDQHLNSQIDKVALGIYSFLGFMDRMKHFVSNKILCVIYIALLRPHINFGVLAWRYSNTQVIKATQSGKNHHFFIWAPQYGHNICP